MERRVDSSSEHRKEIAIALINGGVYAIDRSQLDMSLFPKNYSFERDVLEPLADYGLVAGEVQYGYFIDIGIPEDYARAQRELPEIQAVLKASDAVLAADADTLFLDRDGVINRWLPGDYVHSWEQFAFLPGIRECLRKWAAKFRHVILVSNQRGVGKGKISQAELDAVHARMLEEISAAGGRIDAIYTCSELAPDHPMRKRTGALRGTDPGTGRPALREDGPCHGGPQLQRIASRNPLKPFFRPEKRVIFV